MTGLVEVPTPEITLAMSPDARAFTDGTIAVIRSRDGGSLDVSVSCRDRKPTDSEAQNALALVAPNVVFDEAAGVGINPRVRHFWERPR